MAALDEPIPSVILFKTTNPNLLQEYDQKLEEFKINGRIDINSIAHRQMGGHTVVYDGNRLPDVIFKCTGIAGFGTDRNGNVINLSEDYMKKKSIKDELVSQLYNAMDEKQNDTLLDFLFTAKDSINNRFINNPPYIVNDNTFDLIIKGGGACKIYYERLMTLAGFPPQVPPNIPVRTLADRLRADRLFKESISDIDVDFYGDYDAPTTYLYMVALLRHIRVRHEATIISTIDTILLRANVNILGYINNTNNDPNNTIKNRLNDAFNLQIPNISTHRFRTAVIRLNNKDFKDSIIQKYKKFLYSVDVDDIIQNDNTNYRNDGIRVLGRSVNITFANEYELCNPVTNKFSLARLNIHLELVLDDKHIIPFKISLYDIGYGLDCTEGYLHNRYHTGVKFIKATDRLPVYGLSYIVNDLFNMLYINNIKTWSLPKYTKRIKRLINYAIFLELDYHSKTDVLQTIANLGRAFTYIISDINHDDTSESYHNKISWLMIESQRLKHINSKLYILTDCMIMFLYKKIMDLEKKGDISVSVQNFIQNYWSVNSCNESNIIPFESKLIKENNNNDIADFNSFKQALLIILRDVGLFIGIIYPN
jgi:hypothetical protein